jgi:predicted ester cyclase
MSLSTEEKRNVLKRVSGEVFGQGRIELVDELLAPDFVDHDPLPGMSPDREGVKNVVQLFRTAFPDFEVELLHTIVEGDSAVDHISSTGTHLGEFLGVEATGKRIAASAIVISKLDDDGRIVARWQRFGAMQLLQQLGVIPGWEEPPPVPPLPVVDGGRSTTVEENKSIMTSQLAIWNDGDYELADELFHPHAITPDAPQLPRGPEGCKQVARVFRDAFPDFYMTVEDVVAEGDLVTCRFRQTGTHEGELFGIAPTGRRVDFGEMAICQIAGGQILASWFQTDMLALMSQLGVGGEQPAAPVPT